MNKEEKKEALIHDLSCELHCTFEHAFRADKEFVANPWELSLEDEVEKLLNSFVNDVQGLGEEQE